MAATAWNVGSRVGDDGRVYLDGAELVVAFREKAQRLAAAARAHGDPIPEDKWAEALAQHCLSQMLDSFADDIDVGCLDALVTRA